VSANPVDTSYNDAFAITPSDTTVFNPVARALYIGTAATATLTVVTAVGNTVAFANVGPGVLPLAVKQVKATGTSASNIVGLL
jgi:hypothetical protein